jgi:hypothetical protein
MAHVQSTSANSYSAGTTQYLDLAGVSAGSAIVVFARVATGGANVISGIASNVGGALTKLTDTANATIRFYCWYLENAAAGTHRITYTTVGTGVTVRWAILEYDDVPTSGIVDDFDSATFTTTTAPAANAITTTDTDRVIVSAVATDLSATTIAPATGETERQEVNERFQVQDEAAATAGDYAASWTLGATQPGGWAILALKSQTEPVVNRITTHPSQTNTLLRL